MTTAHARTEPGVALRRDAPQPAVRDIARLPDQITVQHGPVGLLGRFFLKADTAARERGVSLSMGTLEELMAVNRQNRDTWKPLVSLFNPEVSGATPADSFAILGRNAQGEVVATQAARFYDWRKTNLDEEATSLRMLYADPAPELARGERCHVTARSARHIRGRVVFSGAGWYRPDHRGHLLSAILPRISRALAHTRWNSDYTISAIADAVLKGGMARKAGYTNVEKTVDFINAPIAPFMSLSLVWMPTAQLLEDLATFLSGFDAQVDGVVEHRRTQHA